MTCRPCRGCYGNGNSQQAEQRGHAHFGALFILLFTDLSLVMAVRRTFSAGEEFPDLSRHHNVLSKVLTREMYEKLSPLSSKGGYTLDKCIQTGTFVRS